MKLTILALLGLFVLAPFVVTAQATGADPLLAAYQKEFVFLDNEIRLLKERRAEVSAQGETRVATAKKGLNDLEAQLLDLSSRTAQKAEDLKIADSESQKTQDSFDLAQTIINQGNTRLASAGIPLFAETAAAKDPKLTGSDKIQAELAYVFSHSVTMLGEVSGIRSAPGDFFLLDGKKVSGQVTQLGRVAAFGSSSEGGGTLAPAGKDILRLVKPENAAAAQIITAGGNPDTFPLYLYQGLDKNVEIHVEKPWTKALEEGGTVAYVIVLVGVIGFLFAGVRAWNLFRLARTSQAGHQRVTELVSSDDLEGALDAAGKIPGSLGRTLRATVQGLISNPDTVEDALQAQVLDEHPRIDRLRSILTVFVGAAPMLGLLGTVSGMIRVFDTLTIYGTSDPKLVSGGISEALVTTALGLSVAIPLLLVGSLLTSWGDRLTGQLEVKALRLITCHHHARSLAQAVEA